MHLRTLGGLELEGAAFTRPKPLLLLAHLALEGPLPRRRVAHLFWPEARDPLRNLAVALVRLRRGAPGAVDADEARAWAVVDTDVDRFLALLERGRPQQALEAYRGAFLEGVHLPTWSVELEEWVFETREFLAARARWARLQAAEAEAGGGRYETAARHAEAAVAVGEGPMEPEELGRVHTLLLAGRSPEAARVREEAEGFGLHLARTAGDARQRLQEELASGRVGPHNLPMRGGPFMGRDALRHELRASLDRGDARLVTLTGPAGAGKSHLALQVAWERLGSGAAPDGVHLVLLEALASAELVPAATADALGLDAAGHADAWAAVIDHLRDRDATLLFDGFEHVADAADGVAALLEACPRLEVLVTSRQRLDLKDEMVIPVGGLEAPPAEAAGIPEAALRFDAVRLFTAFAQRAHPGFRLDGEVLPHVLQVCRLVDGLPLGLELAAAWVRALPVRSIAQEIERNLDFLSAPTRDVPERHRSLRGAFEHSWRLLSPEEQRVARRLSVCRGGFRRPAARAVAGASIPLLASLVDKSLLRVDDTGRFDRHPLLFQFTRDELERRPHERERSETRHAEHYVALLEAWTEDLVGGRQSEALASVEEDMDNVRAAWHRAAAVPEPALLWRACRPLQLFYIQRGGRAREAAATFARGAEALESEAPEPCDRTAVLGRLRVAEAWFRLRSQEREASLGAARRGTALLRACLARGLRGPGEGDDAALVRALASGENTLGLLAKASDDRPAAGAHLREALRLAREHGFEAQVAIVTHNLAALKRDGGDYQEALALYREALTYNRQRGNRRSVVRNLIDLAGTRNLQGEPERAERALAEARSLASELDYTEILPHVHLGLAEAALARGALVRAEAAARDALRHAAESEAEPPEAHALLGRIAVARGDTDRARVRFGRALELARRSAHVHTTLEVLIGVAELCAADGDPERAARLLDEVHGRGPDSVPHATRARCRAVQEGLGRAPRAASPSRDDLEATVDATRRWLAAP